MRKTDHKTELNWSGKNEVQPPLGTYGLVYNEERSYNSPKGLKDNLLVYGDNLLATKALEMDYTAKVKCIYIDPPYNTKKTLNHYSDNLCHGDWLSMMKIRLESLKNLLTQDGSIWIHIDDSECHYLKVLCDEIFGRRNFVSDVVWQKKNTPINCQKRLSNNHDHILVYAKNKKAPFDRWFLPRTEKTDASYKNPDNNPRGRWVSESMNCSFMSVGGVYKIVNPDTGEAYYPPKNHNWKMSESRYFQLLKEGRIIFEMNGKSPVLPKLKFFLNEVQQGAVAKTIWLLDEVGSNQSSKKETLALNDDDLFQTPKPEALIKKIIQLTTKPGDIVLDSFAGSGTTGAVAHKMGRKWIMIERENTCHTHIIPRIKKVIDGTDLGGITQSVHWKGGGGYEYAETERL